MAMVVLGVMLLTLKLVAVGPFAAWSWWAILAPFGLAIVWWSWADSSGWSKRRAMDEMEARKQQRRQKNLESLGLDAESRRRR